MSSKSSNPVNFEFEVGIGLVKNAEGSLQAQCSECGSWLEHWKRFRKHKDNPKCSYLGCSQISDVGVCVQQFIPKTEIYSEEQFIIPLCSSCNNNRGERFNIDSCGNLVPCEHRKD